MTKTKNNDREVHGVLRVTREKSPIQTLGRRVAVQVDERAKQIGSILLPDNLLKPWDRGMVVAAGAKCRMLTIGDYVVLPRLAGENVIIGGKTYAILQEDQVLGIASVEEAK